jgi:uncharacterized protein (DUF1330 family)
MSVYLINHVFIRAGVDSREALRQLRSTVEAHGGRCCAEDDEDGVEGGQASSLVLVEFADIVAAKNWYISPDYMDISSIYVENAIDLALVDGISPDFTMTGFAQAASWSPPVVRGNAEARR